MNCARDCENSSAYACWEYFHVTGEWMPGCKDIMRDCGCYDSDNEQDCYRKALSYIKNELVLEPESNACVVLEYVKTHFKCIAAITPEDDPEDYDDTDDDWVDGGGNTTSPGTDGPYDETKRKPIWWYHTDHLGSSTYLTDNFGRPSHYYETLPFGEMIVEHNQSTYNGGKYENAYKFNGKELDEATQMYYYGARYYDPRISIFVSVDPLAEQFQGWTPYNYTLNNPIRYIDPDGKAPQDIIILNNPNGAGGFGHMAILIGNDKKGWTFISKEGRNKEPWYSNEVTGGPALKPLVKNYAKLDDFRKDQQKDSNLKGYTQDIRIQTNEKQDQKAKEVALDSAGSWYNVAAANCGDTVSDALEAAGIDGGTDMLNSQGASEVVKTPVNTKTDPRPNKRFEAIKKNNKEKIIPTDSVKRE